MKYFKIDTTDTNIFEKTVYFFELLNTVTNILLSETDVIRDSTPDSTEINKITSAPQVKEANSRFRNIGSTVQTSIKSEKFTFPSENLITTFATVHRPPL